MDSKQNDSNVWIRSNVPAAPIRDLAQELYRELRTIACAKLQMHVPRESLRPTAIINEVYIKLAKSGNNSWEPKHFMVLASRAMEQVLVDHARQRLTARRGFGKKEWVLDDHEAIWPGSDVDAEKITCVHQALEEFEGVSKDSQVAATVMRMKFFAGMEHDQIAKCLGLSESTELRRYNYAKAWLSRRLDGECS